MTLISGSHAYGTPNENSDVDLVIKVDSEEMAMWLYNMLNDSEQDHSDTPRFGSMSIRIGKLNLICCWSDWVYNVWLKGTQQLNQIKPVTRDQAIAMFNNLRINSLETNAILHKAFNPNEQHHTIR